MGSTMETIKQTYRGILFEEINPEVSDNLISFLRDDNITKKFATFHEEGLKKLEVHSYEEFLKIFKPCIYEICRYNEEIGRYEFEFTLKKPEENIIYQEHPLMETQYYKTLDEIYTKKGVSGENNLKFDPKEIFEMMMPQHAVTEAKKVRAQLEYDQKKVDEYERKGLNPASYKKDIIKLRKDIVRKYKASQTALIPLVIHDLETKIESLGVITNDSEPGDENRPMLRSGHFAFDNNGDIMLLEDGKGENSSLVVVGDASTERGLTTVEENNLVVLTPVQETKRASQKIQSYLEKDFDANHPNGGKYIKSLVLSVYSSAELPDDLAVKEDMSLADQKAVYEKRKDMLWGAYHQAQNDLVQEVTELMEKVMGVRAFFDHATDKGSKGGTLQYPLVISNCKPRDLVAGDMVDRFKKVIAKMGNQKAEDRYWLAILPGISDGREISAEEIDVDEAVTVGEESDDKMGGRCERISLGDAKSLIGILAEAKIMTFFNVKGSERTGFFNFTTDKVDEYRADIVEGSNSLNTPYAVFSYPNFTLLGNRNFKMNDTKADDKLNVPGIYIDSSYVAAGLMTASQRPEVLKTKKGLEKRIISGNVCTRVDLEEEALLLPMMTKFNRESGDTDVEIKKNISEDMFGFVFWDEKRNVPIKNSGKIEQVPMKNTYIFSARTLKKNLSSGKYEGIYRTMMRTFLDQYKEINQFRPDNIKENFLDPDVAQWKRDSTANETKEKINLVLKEGENIIFNSEKNILELTLNGEKDPVEIEISDASSNEE